VESIAAINSVCLILEILFNEVGHARINGVNKQKLICVSKPITTNTRSNFLKEIKKTSGTAEVIRGYMRKQHVCIRLPDVLNRQGLSLNLLSKLVMSLTLEKRIVVLGYFPASLNCCEIVHY